MFHVDEKVLLFLPGGLFYLYPLEGLTKVNIYVMKKYISMSDEEIKELLSRHTKREDIKTEVGKEIYLYLLRKGVLKDLPKIKKTSKPKKKIRTDRIDFFKKVNINGEWMCGRCFKDNSFKKNHTNTCTKCYSTIVNRKMKGVDTNPWNIRDEFVNIKITDEGREWYIGLRTNRKTQEELARLGYSFIFKRMEMEWDDY